MYTQKLNTSTPQQLDEINAASTEVSNRCLKLKEMWNYPTDTLECSTWDIWVSSQRFLSKEERIIAINQSLNRFIGSVISFFMNQFICLVYIMFLFAGVVCGLISGLIEYEVFAELYKKVTATNLPIFSIPLLIVFSLEITKIFLVFLDKQASLTNNEGYISDRTTFNYEPVP